MGYAKRGHKGRTDRNHTEIIEGLRAIVGVTVRSTAMIGDGFPDIVCGYAGKNYLFEIKYKGVLTKKELKFMDDWTGQVDVIFSLNDAKKIMRIK